MQNYFELFDLETSFFIDESSLKEAYQREIARFHPDQFASRGDSEKLQALQNTSLLNTAFESIKSPLNRASYLLKLEGIDAFDERDTSMDHDFLISQIELREELELLRLKQNPDDLEDYLDKVEEQIQSKIDLTVSHPRFDSVVAWYSTVHAADGKDHRAVRRHDYPARRERVPNPNRRTAYGNRWPSTAFPE